MPKSHSSSSPPKASSSSFPAIPVWKGFLNGMRGTHLRRSNSFQMNSSPQVNFMGEDLDSLSLKELQNLEHQLESALKHIRSRKNQVMYESISELQKKDKALQEQNNALAKKIKEKEKAQEEQLGLQTTTGDVPSLLITEPLEPFNNIGGSSSTPQAAGGGGDGLLLGDNEDQSTTPTQPNNNHSNNLLPPWMVRPIMNE
ncbi:hypothetical protein PIB30_118811 [Stylosanthes scabra]|uniref:K-box domain-containing protein n=1 Tax=Stylosanthes scabra TaxID=79078 RepID=A0ABU6S9I2_9FABA|nr:hypothetical protein [Stylosanthes scabra]